ncbi:DNA ligase [Mesorhizobium loti]|uniref:DNA ligase n=1 Tax=Mesorhizobium jarvisii TaxID=1777867 RepID=A0A6M7TIA7_9HYPH|nr:MULTISPECIES: RNA ligase family protein [Mesorhizobium]OBQ59587.1 DNA ligase [Mesorhizobium loti]QKC64674.1 DNA ligase [Mesorhizobium jarvisii]QKD10588.1 DNA ligase [Mesorhizobium loti]RJT30578.1 DNA ligase [Mesorhizobium jarvisii]
MRSDQTRLKFIKPQEPLLVLEVPLSDDWLHEIKYDGFRTQLILDWAGGRAFTRTGIDWSKRYWPIVAALEKLPAKTLILDGEVIAPEADGRPNFHQMHSRMAWNAELLAFVAFDILHKDGKDLRALPTIERKAILWNVVKPAEGIIQYSQHVEGGGAEFFAAVDKMGLEGMVSKRKNSPYRAGKSDAWVKAKCWDVADFELIGVKRERGKQTEGLMARDGKYVGSAVIATNRSIKERLLRRLERARAEQPAGVPKAIAGPSVEWVSPGITARVRYLRGESKLRHASVQDLHDEGT